MISPFKWLWLWWDSILALNFYLQASKEAKAACLRDPVFVNRLIRGRLFAEPAERAGAFEKAIRLNF